MNRYLTYILFILILASCSQDELLQPGVTPSDAIEIKGVEAYVAGNIGTRAPALDAYNYVGRSTFINGDQMVLTTIKRTDQPINGFHYSGIVYDHVVETGQTSGGWNRDPQQGHAHNDQGGLLSEFPERIYWSDAHNGHTYIGYSKPKGEFDWEVKEATYGGAGTVGIPVYYGSLGDPTQLQTITGQDANGKDIIINYIDYTNEAGETPVSDNNPSNPGAKSYKSGNEKIKKDDILLTYDTDKHAETGGSVAKLYFHHGLAQVRVIVNIQGFSASTDAVDSRSIVSGMILKDMLTLYKWRQETYTAEALDAQYDKNNIDAIYNNSTDGAVKCDQKKDVHLWIPRPDGTGAGVGKQFTFYGLAVPTTMAAETLNLQFTVTYQDPMNPWTDAQKTEPNMKDHTYTAKMPSEIEFRAGHCTTINISLNHNNEQMTVGAEYMDWQLVETPDQGELKKNDTFLTSTARKTGTDTNAPGATIVGDPLATEDDATWLYDSGSGVILDIYGNNGTSKNPYTISTADQLLSFAYEVKNGRTFGGQYIRLDADITLQKSLEEEDISWIGIGDAENPFNGVFNGGYRHINRLKGAPFFNTIGADGIVDHIFISEALGITGRGSIAEVNNGVICGAYIEGDVEATNNGTLSGSYCGSIVGENHSMLISCSHIGDIKGTNYESVGALLGYNDGIVAICYNSGNVTSSGSGSQTYAGVGKYSPKSIAYCSYYNGDLYKGSGYTDHNARIGHVAYPLTTAMMQSNTFVNKPAPYQGLTKEHEIIDDGLPLQEDPFFFHLSLNYGIRRAVAMLQRALAFEADAQGYIPIHGASTDPEDPNQFEVLKLKKTLVQWLIDHYSYMDGSELKFSHQFQFVPGTYPRLQ